MIGHRVDEPGEWDAIYEYDREQESPSEVVVRAIATATNRDVFSFEPLYETIQPDALDTLLESNTAAVSFVYADCRVYVDGTSVAVDSNAPETL